MRWLRYKLKDGSYAQETIASTAGYAIVRTRASIPGVVASAAPYRYIAFKGFSDRPGQFVLGGYETSEEAKAACESHAAKVGEIA